jgi:hypothetical protein
MPTMQIVIIAWLLEALSLMVLCLNLSRNLAEFDLSAARTLCKLIFHHGGMHLCVKTRLDKGLSFRLDNLR